MHIFWYKHEVGSMPTSDAGSWCCDGKSNTKVNGHAIDKTWGKIINAMTTSRMSKSGHKA